MPTEAKQAAVAALKEELSNSKAAIVADYRGLTVSDISAVRRSLHGDGITYKVVKNRLAKIAATEAGRGELNELLDGPTALAMGQIDEVTLARVFLDAIKPYKTVVIRGGIVGETRIDAASITRMAALPGREVLLAQLAGGMASPLATMASLLAAPLRNLGYALSQVAEQRAQAAGPVAEAPKAEAAPAAAAEADVATPGTESAEAEAPEAAAAAEPEAPEAEVAAEPEAPEAEAAAETPEAAAAAETPEAAAAAEPEAPEAEVAAEAPEAEVAAETPEATDESEPKSE